MTADRQNAQADVTNSIRAAAWMIADEQAAASERYVGNARERTSADEPELSIVIPAFNEAQRLPGSLATVKDYLDQKPTTSEVIIVDDGSTDGTGEIVKAWTNEWPALRLVQESHHGKGGAVRSGVLAASGKYIALADVDFSMPVEEIEHLTNEVKATCDVAIGSREAPGARRIDEPWPRHLMSRVFNTLVRLLLLPGIRDTQCGFKCLRREVAIDLCQRQTIDGWAFDPELLYIARRRGYRMYEIPISWRYMPGSRMHPIRDALRMLREVLTVRANSNRGIYDW